MDTWQRTAVSFKPYLIVFVASACGLVLEIVAARLLAPKIGVSLYTWTSIIGVVLAGISVGSYLGGVLADRFPNPTTLGIILLSAGAACLSVLPLAGPVADAFEPVPIIARIVFLTATLFFLPSAILGMVTPLVVKLTLRDLGRTGNVVGKIYAVSTAGAIFGVFSTGFVLVQIIGTRQTIFLVALVLVAMSVAFGSLWRVRLPTVSAIIALMILGAISWSGGHFSSGCLRESNYYCIRVSDEIKKGQPMKVLHLDNLLHSYVSLENPAYLTYEYETVLSELSMLVASHNPEFRALIIGGGGYTMPRYLMQAYPQSQVEVIEIDPEVTQVAYDYLGLPRDSGMVIYHEDARMAVPKLPLGQYDLVIGDAFNDVAIPYHLTTKEFNDQVKALMAKDGIYAVNLIDRFQSGRFARSFVSTLQMTFPYVYLIRGDRDWNNDERETVVVVSSSQPLTREAIQAANIRMGRDQTISNFMPEELFATWLQARDNILLTDDYAPVDNLLAPVYLEKLSRRRDFEYFNAGVELAQQGLYLEAIGKYSDAVLINPRYAMAYNNRGSAFTKLGEHRLAIDDYAEAIRIEGEFAGAYFNRGMSYQRLHRDQEAIDDLGYAVRLDPRFALAYIARGDIFSRQGEYRRAIEDYDQAINVNPKDRESYNKRGNAYAGVGRHLKAIEDFDQAILLQSDFAQPYNDRGKSYAYLDQHRRAIQDYTSAVRLDPNHGLAYANRAVSYVSLADFKRAIQDYDKAIRIHPQDSKSFNLRGLVYYGLGEHQQAIEGYSEAIRINPGYIDAYMNRGAAYSKLRQFGQAVEDYNQIIQLLPEDGAAYAHRSLAYLALGQDGLALEDFNQAVRLGEDAVELKTAMDKVTRRP